MNSYKVYGQKGILTMLDDIINYLVECQIDIGEAISQYPIDENPLHLEGQLFAVDEILDYVRELRDAELG